MTTPYTTAYTSVLHRTPSAYSYALQGKSLILQPTPMLCMENTTFYILLLCVTQQPTGNGILVCTTNA